MKPRKKKHIKHKGNEMEFLSRFVPHIPIYDCYRRKLVGEELVRESAPRLAEGGGGGPFVGAENRDSWGRIDGRNA